MTRGGKRTSGAAAPRPSLDRDAVVAEAARLVDEEGLDALSVSGVARRLGVTQPALYKHIDSADDLLAGLALLTRELLVERLTAAAVGRERDAALHAVSHAWRSVAAEHPGLYEATDRVALTGDSTQEEAVAGVVDVLAKVAESYGLSSEEARLSGWALRSALHGFAALETDRGHPLDFDLEDGFEHLVQLLSEGLTAAATMAASE
ncbi:MAG TPA: WHG domain-containing protein [Acidimicrobiales bacterium]